MDKHDVAAMMARPISQQLLQASIPARLAYTALDGDPRVVPMGWWWNGTALVMATAPKAAKVAALRRHPKVAVTIDTEGFPPQALLIRGAATLELVESVPHEYIEGGRRFMTAEQFVGWEAGVRDLYERMVRITIEPHWAKLLDFETTIPKAVEDLVRERQSGGDAR